MVRQRPVRDEHGPRRKGTRGRPQLRHETISAKEPVLNYKVLTSGKPSKRNRSFPIGSSEKLIVYQSRRKVALGILAQEAGQQFHVIRLTLGRVREHEMSAGYWRTRAWR